MNGDIFAIGGHEDREGDRTILRAVAESMPRPKLVVVTAATRHPDEMFETYRKAFGDLGPHEILPLDVRSRDQGDDPVALAALDGAGGIFFTGGDQLRITSQLGDTAVERAILDAWHDGAVIAGTSAGASVLSETMLVRGASEESHHIGDLDMAPGLGYLTRVIVDQHFAERGRIGRLLGAVAKNPRLMGLGIDEDTAVCVRGDELLVVGSGAVYMIDASKVTQSNIAETAQDAPLSMFDVCFHVLSDGDGFDLQERRPLSGVRV